MRDDLRRLPAVVWATGAVSFFTDLSSEMIYPLLPLFLTGPLHATRTVLGLVEGFAEAVASGMRLWGGARSDRKGHYRPLILGGYSVSTIARPLVALATSPVHVLALRVVDRVGKGVRGPPRDALVARLVAPDQRGLAFGVQRGLDNAGAVAGPLVAATLLALGLELRSVFALALVPGLLCLATIVRYIHDPAGESGEPAPAPQGPASASDARGAAPSRALDEGGMRPARAGGDRTEAPPDAPMDPPAAAPAPSPTEDASTGAASTGADGLLGAYLVALGLFALGNSSDQFLLLRAQGMGVGAMAIPLLWAMHNLVRVLAAVVGGRLSDRAGRRRMILWGWVVYAFVYMGFARLDTAGAAWALMALYAVYYGMTEGVQSALLADLVPAERRGRAYGWMQAVTGAAALPASVLAGGLWEVWGPGVALGVGAALAGLAAGVLMAFVRERPPASPGRIAHASGA